MEVAQQPSADELLRGAHEASYRLPPGFAGFRAELRFSGPAEAVGEITVRAGARPQLEIDLPDTEARWLEHELSSLVGHRFHRPYEEADGPTDKKVGDEDGNPHGRLIVLEDEMNSSYRIGGGLINEINRTHGGGRFTILIQDRFSAPDGRMVSSSFTVCHWGGEDDRRLVGADAYSDTYVESDGVLLPSRRRVASASDSGLTVRQFELEGHEVLVEEGAR